MKNRKNKSMVATVAAKMSQSRTLNDEYSLVENRLGELSIESNVSADIPTEQDVAEALRTIEPLWDELFPAEKERIVRLLVEKVIVRPDGLQIRLHPTGLMTLTAEVASESAATKDKELLDTSA